jgi:hypothetical protein
LYSTTEERTVRRYFLGYTGFQILEDWVEEVWGE